MSLRNSLDLDLKHLRGPVGNNGKDLSFSTLSIHPEACYVKPTVKNEMQKTQHKYISREYDLSLDIEFLIKNDG
ncbi:unnamed protein product [Rhizophagus irregularis]|nr:unnamed protein product [Rhizophagus irregularis]